VGYQDFQPLRDRAFRFALAVSRFARGLPGTAQGRRAGDQLFRAASAVAANYRAAAHARSPSEFIARMAIVVEEADEAWFWLAFIKEANVASGDEVLRLTTEARELAAIFGACLATAKRNARNKQNQEPPG
jgi:four helix bundle protein